jgi:hypothetical protein
MIRQFPRLLVRLGSALLALAGLLLILPTLAAFLVKADAVTFSDMAIVVLATCVILGTGFIAAGLWLGKRAKDKHVRH